MARSAALIALQKKLTPLEFHGCRLGQIHPTHDAVGSPSPRCPRLAPCSRWQVVKKKKKGLSLSALGCLGRPTFVVFDFAPAVPKRVAPKTLKP
eukprot:194270-Prorocentrum_minimum.AAC.1